MKKLIVLLLAGVLLLTACNSSKGRGIYVKKHSKKCGTCPVW